MQLLHADCAVTREPPTETLSSNDLSLKRGSVDNNGRRISVDPAKLDAAEGSPPKTDFSPLIPQENARRFL